jgi:hypothetical protein
LYRAAVFAQSNRRYVGLIYPPPSHPHDAQQDGVTGKTRAREITMFTNATFALAFMLAAASGALAATKTHSIAPSHDGYTVYNPAGAYVGADPDLNILFELNRDWDRGH